MLKLITRRIVQHGYFLNTRPVCMMTHVPHAKPLVDKYEEPICSECKKETRKCDCDDFVSDPMHPLNPIMPLNPINPFNPLNHSNALPVAAMPRTIRYETTHDSTAENDGGGYVDTGYDS